MNTRPKPNVSSLPLHFSLLQTKRNLSLPLPLQALRSLQGPLSQAKSDFAHLDLIKRKKMNRCAYQQKGFAACGEMRGPTNAISGSDSVVCPKPRRLGILNPSINDQIRPSRLLMSNQSEICESNAGTELLDIFLTKGAYGAEKPNNVHVASSPPFFSGSPPSRASNPLIQDSQFWNNKFSSPLSPTSPSSAARNGGMCARMKFGQKPAMVRVEGFDCLNRDRQNRSVSAVA